MRHLRRKIEAAISPSLDLQLRAAQEANGHNVNPRIASIVDKIMSSPEYAALVASITEDARNNVESVARLQEQQQRFSNAQASRRDFRASSFGSTSGSSMRPGHSGRHHESSFSIGSNTTNESSSGSLSLTHSPALEEIKAIAISLNPRNALDIRLTAIQV